MLQLGDSQRPPFSLKVSKLGQYLRCNGGGHDFMLCPSTEPPIFRTLAKQISYPLHSSSSISVSAGTCLPNMRLLLPQQDIGRY